MAEEGPEVCMTTWRRFDTAIEGWAVGKEDLE